MDEKYIQINRGCEITTMCGECNWSLDKDQRSNPYVKIAKKLKEEFGQISVALFVRKTKLSWKKAQEIIENLD